jgi:hypothetical protein
MEKVAEKAWVRKVEFLASPGGVQDDCFMNRLRASNNFFPDSGVSI